MGFPQWLKQKKSIDEQRSKQTNKHFKDPKYLSQIKSDIQENHRVTSYGCSKMIKIKKKQTGQQTNKQTNKQINIF